MNARNHSSSAFYKKKIEKTFNYLDNIIVYNTWMEHITSIVFLNNLYLTNTKSIERMFPEQLT